VELLPFRLRLTRRHHRLATIVGAGIDTFWVPELPAPIQVVLAVRLLATADELEQEEPHQATNRVRDPRGEVVSEMSGELTVQAESARPEWLIGVSLGSVVQFEATEEGTYTLEHAIDDSSAQLPIHVVLGTP
jgi:hypothetical protein